MKHTNEQIMLGVKTIRTLRSAVYNKTNESATSIIKRMRPKYYMLWSILLRRLGILRVNESGFGFDKEYWNQPRKETDYDLCIRILNEYDNYLESLNKKNIKEKK